MVSVSPEIVEPPPPLFLLSPQAATPTASATTRQPLTAVLRASNLFPLLVQYLPAAHPSPLSGRHAIECTCLPVNAVRSARPGSARRRRNGGRRRSGRASRRRPPDPGTCRAPSAADAGPVQRALPPNGRRHPPPPR